MSPVVTRKAGYVAPLDVAPDEVPNKMRWLRGEPVPKTVIGNPGNQTTRTNRHG